MELIDEWGGARRCPFANLWTFRSLRFGAKRIAAVVSTAVAGAFVSGCSQDKGHISTRHGLDPGVGKAPLVQAEPPRNGVQDRDPKELRGIHNLRVASIRSLYMVGTVRAKYKENGQEVSQLGEGELGYQRSSSGYLTFGKAGSTLLWSGTNGVCYWLFAVPERRACVCRSSNATTALFVGESPIVHPLDLIDLLGLSSIPGDFPGERVTESSLGINGSPVAMYRYRVTRSRTELLMTLDDGGLVRQVNVLDRTTGVVLGIARLGAYQPLAVTASANIPRPLVPTTLVLESVVADARVELTADYFGEAPNGKSALNPRVFDFSALASTFRPREILVLDGNLPHPALSPDEVRQLIDGGGSASSDPETKSSPASEPR